MSVTAILRGHRSSFSALLLQVGLHFSFQAAFDQRFGQLLEDATFAQQVFRTLVAFEQFIEDFRGKVMGVMSQVQ
jgi:hypothetical protein